MKADIRNSAKNPVFSVDVCWVFFYRPDFQKLLMFLLIKRLDRAFQRLGQSTELFKHLVERRSFSNT